MRIILTEKQQMRIFLEGQIVKAIATIPGGDTYEGSDYLFERGNLAALNRMLRKMDSL